ncbi:MAG: DJ-1/PfpI family protein [Promethearchaeota archaeon]
MSRHFRLICITLIISVITLNCCTPTKTSVTSSNTFLDEYNIIILVADGVGNCYYVIEEYLEGFGANITTVGLYKTIRTCNNKGEAKYLTANITISEINEITDYDAIVVPSGGYWGSMMRQTQVKDLISHAYKEGLIIASFCVGTVILAVADILDGINVLSHENVNEDVIESGANIITDATTISDSRIITADKGGGLAGGGYNAAPIYEFCLAIAKALLGYSYIKNTDVQSLGEGKYSIDVETQTPNLPIDDYNPEIDVISASSYDISKEESYGETIILTEDEENIYTGELEIQEDGKYTLNLEVKDTVGNLEIIRDISTITIGNPVPAWEFLILLLSLFVFSNLGKRKF